MRRGDRHEQPSAGRGCAPQPFLPPPVPALVVGSVSHTRRTPLVHTFTHRHYQWLVDLDDLPRLRRPLAWLARFDAADHLDGGRLGGGIRGDLERFLDHRGVTLAPDDRVLMLAHARVLGHTFDPMSAFWCLRPDGAFARSSSRSTTPTATGTRTSSTSTRPAGPPRTRSCTSPRSTTRPGATGCAWSCDPSGSPSRSACTGTASASWTPASTGVPVPLTTRTLLTTVARHALMTQRVTALIRVHGIWLWLRRLPVHPRPRTHRRLFDDHPSRPRPRPWPSARSVATAVCEPASHDAVASTDHGPGPGPGRAARRFDPRPRDTVPARRAGDPGRAARRVLRAARRAPQDRLRRGIHGRRLAPGTGDGPRRRL